MFNKKTVNKSLKKYSNGIPVFYLIYSGANHTPGEVYEYPKEIQNKVEIKNLWEINEKYYNWKNKYSLFIQKSDKELIELIDTIIQFDPESLILLTGDHGAYMYRNAWMGDSKDPNENIINNGFKVETITKDCFEIFVALRYPKEKIDLTGASPVNYFRRIFYILSGGDRSFKNEVANDSFIPLQTKSSIFGKFKIYKTVENGQVLKEWVPIKEY